MYSKPFNVISKHDADIAGGKGASLGEMTQAGIPVPPGFVILASTFDHFIQQAGIKSEIDSLLKKVNLKDVNSINNISEEIQYLIKNAETSKDIEEDIIKNFKILNAEFVAVRSSATAEDSADAAWAGQLDTFLNTTETDLLKNVKNCWASLFTPRAIFYRFEKEIQGDISVAVVIQKMIQSEISGVAFSVHPVTQDYNQALIEAGVSLGEAIVSGQITPDSYTVKKQELEIEEITVNQQLKKLVYQDGKNTWLDLDDEGKEQFLTRDQILELAQLIITIEHHYHFPCDIEWAYENKKFFITQSRPITTLTAKEELDIPHKAKRIFAKNQIDIQSPRGSIFNLSMPYRAYMTANVLYGDNFLDGIWVYFKELNFSQITVLDNFTKLTKKYLEMEMKSPIFDAFLDEQQQIADELTKDFPILMQDLTTDRYQKFINKISEWWYYALLGEDKGQAIEEELRKVLVKKVKPIDVDKTLSTLATPDVMSIFSQERVDFYNLCIKSLNEGTPNLDNYLSKYFFIESSFVDLTVIDKDSVMEKIKKATTDHDLEWFRTKNAELKDNLKKVIEKQNNIFKKYQFSEEEKSLISFFQKFSHWLDIRKENMMKLFYYSSSIVHYLCEKHDRPYEYFSSYTHDEVADFLRDDKELSEKEVQQRRNGCCLVYSKEGLEFVYDKDAKKILEDAYASQVSGGLKGTVANMIDNTVEGFVKIIRDAKNEPFKEGEILVAAMTRIEFVPLMKKAKAIITDEGGVACHASIVSRELGIPCIIGTKNATRILKDGDKVKLDLITGKITKLDEKDEWEELIRSDFYAYNVSIALQSIQYSNSFVKGPKYQKILLYIKGGMAYYYENFRDHHTVGDYILDKFMQDQDMYKDYVKEWLTQFQDLDTFLRKVRKMDLSTLDDKQLGDLLNNIYTKAITWHGIAYNVDAIDVVLNPLLETCIKQT
ncbi:PEP/pyruvate-binding domain-containing protein, partial [Nanoarchaeota archaeon]